MFVCLAVSLFSDVIAIDSLTSEEGVVSAGKQLGGRVLRECMSRVGHLVQVHVLHGGGVGNVSQKQHTT